MRDNPYAENVDYIFGHPAATMKRDLKMYTKNKKNQRPLILHLLSGRGRAQNATEYTDYQGWHSPSSLAGILARSASISSSKGGIGVSENFGITLKISLTMSASQQT